MGNGSSRLAGMYKKLGMKKWYRYRKPIPVQHTNCVLILGINNQSSMLQDNLLFQSKCIIHIPKDETLKLVSPKMNPMPQGILE